MTKVGLIGFGAIGAAVVSGWDRLSGDYQMSALCVRPSQAEAARHATPPGAQIVTSVEAFLEQDVDLIIEAAGHDGLRSIGARALRDGRDVYALSIGALADEAFSDLLTQASLAGGGRIIVPSGALAGFDGLMAMRESDLTSARYVSTKPPLAWRNTPAEGMIDLDCVAEPVTFFRGSAREAAKLFPKNANLAAAVAIAGLGFDRTEIELVANPTCDSNMGEVVAVTPTAELAISVRGQSFEDNPKSSAIVSASVISSLRNAVARVAFR